MGSKRTKLLYLSDLYEFYSSQKKNATYDSKKSRANMVVHIDGAMNFENDDYDPNAFKVPVSLKLCHTNKNANGSDIPREVMDKALSSVYNIPILGFIYKDDDDEYQFAGHEFYEEDNEMVYEEIPIGVINESSDMSYEYDDEHGWDNLHGTGIIWKDYTKAYEILSRDKEHPVSIEINVDKLTYDADSDTLIINEFHFKGVTILGKDRDDGRTIQPGMEGASITLSDFSQKNNALFTKSIVDTVLKQVYQTLKENEESEKGGSQVDKFAELLEKYHKTAEDVTFDYDGLSDEELEAKFAEVFGEDEGEPEGELEAEPEPTGEEPASDPEPTGDSAQFSIARKGNVKNFAMSYDDIRWQLYDQFNEAHATDDEWFGVVDVFDNDVAIFGNWDGKYYRQSFTKSENTVTLVGEVDEVFATFVTEAEKAALDMLQSNYDQAAEELQKYHEVEETEKKNALMGEEYYSVLANTDEFKALKNDIGNLSYEDVKAKADALLLAHYKNEKNTEAFSANTQSETEFQVTEMPVGSTETKTSRYEGLF